MFVAPPSTHATNRKRASVIEQNIEGADTGASTEPVNAYPRGSSLGRSALSMATINERTSETSLRGDDFQKQLQETTRPRHGSASHTNLQNTVRRRHRSAPTHNEEQSGIDKLYHGVFQ